MTPLMPSNCGAMKGMEQFLLYQFFVAVQVALSVNLQPARVRESIIVPEAVIGEVNVPAMVGPVDDGTLKLPFVIGLFPSVTFVVPMAVQTSPVHSKLVVTLVTTPPVTVNPKLLSWLVDPDHMPS